MRCGMLSGNELLWRKSEIMGISFRQERNPGIACRSHRDQPMKSSSVSSMVGRLKSKLRTSVHPASGSSVRARRRHGGARCGGKLRHRERGAGRGVPLAAVLSAGAFDPDTAEFGKIAAVPQGEGVPFASFPNSSKTPHPVNVPTAAEAVKRR